MKAGINMTITYDSVRDILQCLKSRGWYCNDRGRILYTRYCDNFMLQSVPYKGHKMAMDFLEEQQKNSPLQAVVLVKEHTEIGLTLFFTEKNVLVISFSRNCKTRRYSAREFADFPWYIEEVILPLAQNFTIESCECSQVGGMFE